MPADKESKINLVETFTKILQGIAIIVGIWATYFAYQQHNEDIKIQENERLQQLAKEYRKNFYEKQLQFYIEATEATAAISTEEKGSEEYNKAKKDFYRLFWGKLSIVEDRTVEARMVKFNRLLEDFDNNRNNVTQDDLKQASLRLAHDASLYTINVWVDSTERKNYNR
jgi:hypothetical protein